MAEVLHDVQPVSAANHTQPDHVIGRVEQVRAMRGRKHEMFVPVLGVVIESNVFSFVIKKQGSGGGQPLRQGGLDVKLMRQLTRFEHGLRVDTSGGGKSAIEFESR